MIMGLYGIYDKVAQESGQLFEAKNDGVALRAFSSLMPKTNDPEEYDLMRFGTIDHVTNQITLLEKYEILKVKE